MTLRRHIHFLAHAHDHVCREQSKLLEKNSSQLLLIHYIVPGEWNADAAHVLVIKAEQVLL